MFETTLGEKTFFKEIKQVPPASYLIYDGFNLEIQKYWNINPQEKKYCKEKGYIEELRFLVEDSIEIRKPPNLNFGVSVSGGLDSAIISCLSKPDYLFSSITKRQGYNEERYVDVLSKFLKINVIKTYPTVNEFKKMLPSMLWHLDEPVTTLAAFPAYVLSQKASKYVKVMLNGQGADELFGGYVRHLLIYLEHMARSIPQLNRYEPLSNHFWKENYNKTLPERYLDLLARHTITDRKEVLAILNSFFSVFENRPVSSAGYTDLNISFPSLLRTEDRVSMAWGIETRSPFLDYRIVDFAFSLPDNFKIRWGEDQTLNLKYLLRETFKDKLPTQILKRIDKVGYPSPVALWLNNELDQTMRNVLPYFRSIEEFLFIANNLNIGSVGEFDRSKWQILQLTIWYLIFVKKYSLNEVRKILE